MNTEQKIHTLLSKTNQKSGIRPNGLTTDCWEWIGHKDTAGYGRLRTEWAKELKTDKTHRLSYILHKGEFDRSLDVLHSCDNPCCINPDHLRLGTQQENNKDRDERGRQKTNRGSNNGNANFTEDQLQEICLDFQSGKRIVEIARKFGVEQHSIGRIINGKTYSRINQREERDKKIKEDRKAGMSYKDLVTKYSLSRVKLWQIIKD